MKLSLGPVVVAAAFLAVAAVGCAGSEPEASSSTESHATDGAIAPGKYVTNGKMLMVYSQCSSANFLGEAATGAIDASGVMHAPEGDVCGSYRLATTAEGEVTVTWNRDPSAHLDAASITACQSNEGKYLMMAPGAFVEPKPGTYAKPNSPAVFKLPAGCDTPATLTGGGAPIARTKSDAEHPFGYLATDQGNVCSGYSYAGLPDGTLKITWVPPAKASIAHDLGVSAACKSVEGIYKPR